MKIAYILNSIEDISISKSKLERYFNRDNEVWIIAVNISLDTIIEIRQLFRGYIPCERILYFEKSSLDNILFICNSLDIDRAILIEDSSIKRYRISKERVSNNRPKLAYFSPFEPAKSGIATYTTELLPYLAKYYDITLVADDNNLNAQTNYQGIEFELIGIDEFKSRVEEFDRVLHHIGNSRYHIYSCKILQECSGVVVLHDFFLNSMQRYIEFECPKRYFWGLRIFINGGYLPFKEYFDERNYEKLGFEFPVNLSELQRARGVITHSKYSKKLSKEWYIDTVQPPWRVIPHLRELPTKIDRESARKQLCIDEDTILICSFGHINKTKLSHKLLDAFIASELFKHKKALLVFAGSRSDPNYCKEMEEKAKRYGYENRVKITGWIDMELYRVYLQAADIAVQLRTLSRGETSGTVLDTMAYGVPTIINANGSMAEIDDSVVIKLRDDFDVIELIEALETLEDKQVRERLSKKAQEYISTKHNPSLCAKLYYDAIESYYAIPNRDISIPSRPRQRQILVDVTVLSRKDYRTGIQRVARAQLLQLMQIAPKDTRVEAVYLSNDGGRWHFRYASEYICRLLDIPISLADREVEIEAGDIFYGVDFHTDTTIEAINAGLFREWRANGVLVSFTIHDLLPIEAPHFFPEGTEEFHTRWFKGVVKNSDLLVCTSNTGVDTVNRWIDKLNLSDDRLPKVVSVYLGSDIKASAPDSGSDEYSEIFQEMKSRPTFIVVGTIEPRKGHYQTLKAFEELWIEGIEVGLIFIGKEGWIDLDQSLRRTIPQTMEAIRVAQEKYPYFKWLNSVDDANLERFYQNATAFLFPSEDEGFGIPLIEAAHYELPIIVRDRPIFRELAGEYADYFENDLNPTTIAKAIKRWIESYKRGDIKSSKGMPYITWQESAERLYKEFMRIC